MTIGIQYTLAAGVTTSTGGRLSGSSIEYGSTEHGIDLVLAASTTNQLVTIALTVANIQSFLIESDADVTIKVNSSGSPTETIALKGGIPFLYGKSSGYFTNPFATNVTALYLTNTVATRFQAKFLTT